MHYCKTLCVPRRPLFPSVCKEFNFCCTSAQGCTLSDDGNACCGVSIKRSMSSQLRKMSQLSECTYDIGLLACALHFQLCPPMLVYVMIGWLLYVAQSALCTPAEHPCGWRAALKGTALVRYSCNSRIIDGAMTALLSMPLHLLDHRNVPLEISHVLGCIFVAQQ